MGGSVECRDDAQVAKLAASDATPEAILEELYLAAYGRRPTAAEHERLLPEFAREGASRRAVAEDILWALLNTPEFVYVN